MTYNEHIRARMLATDCGRSEAAHYLVDCACDAAELRAERNADRAECNDAGLYNDDDCIE